MHACMHACMHWCMHACMYTWCVCVRVRVQTKIYVDCVMIGMVFGPVPAHQRRPLLQDQAPTEAKSKHQEGDREQSKFEILSINILSTNWRFQFNQHQTTCIITLLLRDFHVMQMSSNVARCLCFHLILRRLMLLERPPQDCRLHPLGKRPSQEVGKSCTVISKGNNSWLMNTHDTSCKFPLECQNQITLFSWSSAKLPLRFPLVCHRFPSHSVPRSSAMRFWTWPGPVSLGHFPLRFRLSQRFQCPMCRV